MNRTIAIIITVIVLALLAIVVFTNRQNRADNGSVSYDVSDETEARETVEQFGRQLKAVSLTASPDAVRGAIDQYYAPYIAPELLAEWKANVSLAPGRATSSPWPERIVVQSVSPEVDSTITVEGTVVELTSAEVVEGGIAASYPVRIELEDRNGELLITDFERGQYNNGQVATTIDGIFSCLPHKDTSGPVTLECAFGLETAAGQHYAIDTSLLVPQELAILSGTSGRIRVTGTITPVEELSANRWQQYNIVGVIQATNVQKLPPVGGK